MPSLAFYFLACLMSVATVSSRKMPIPAYVNHPDEQCVLRGHLGACAAMHNVLTLDIHVDCKNLECAAPLHGKAANHRATSIGRAARGTHCGDNKICYDGDCIDLPQGINLPMEIHEGEEGFICFRPNSGKPSSGHSG